MSDTEQVPLLDRSGTIVNGRYRFLQRIGSGGMGEVYEAEHLLIGKRVALKCLLPDFALNPQVIERFKREARAAASIGNPHIVDIVDMGDLPDGAPFIAMEMLEGKPLSGLFSEGPMTVGRIVSIALQVCDALGAAHERGIVHRDLKPDNIFVCMRRRDEIVKVLDFGISKVLERGPASASLTQTGMALGTPLYMSPEQAQGLRTVDHRTDIWALGVVIYEAIAGQVPFTGETYPLLLLSVMTDDPLRLSVHRADLPPGFEGVVMKCLEKPIDRRHASMGELARALEPFARITNAPNLVPGRPISIPPPRSAMSVRGLSAFRSDQPGAPTTADAPENAKTQLPDYTEPNPVVLHDSRKGAKGAPGTWGSDTSEGLRKSGEKSISESDLPAASSGKRNLRSRFGGILVAALLAIAGGGTWIGLGRSVRKSTNEVVNSGLSQRSQGSPAPTSRASEIKEAAPPASTVPKEVRVRVRAIPADARIAINGVDYPNPMDAMQPRSLSPVKLAIAREGYRNVERSVIFDNDFALEVELAPLSGPFRSVRRAAPSSSSEPSGSEKEIPKSTQRTGQPARNDGIYRGRSGEFSEEW